MPYGMVWSGFKRLEGVMSDRCTTCRYWDRDDFGEARYPCRRFPKTGPDWPYVHREDWCGEHRPRDGVIADYISPDYLEREAARIIGAGLRGRTLATLSKEEIEELHKKRSG